MEKKVSKTLNHLYLMFIDYMKYTKKVSPHTLRAYKKDLRDFFDSSKKWEALDSQSIKTISPLKIQNKKNLELIIKDSIKKRSLKWTKLAPASKGRKLATIRSFIKWLSENHYIQTNFGHLFKSPKQPVKIPNFLSVDEILAINNKLQQEKNSKTRDRDRSLFFLLYGGGLRVSEACHLKTKNIDWNNSTIKVKGKGNKERLVALPSQAITHLKPLKNNFPYLFGKAPLSERKAYDIIRNLGKKTGLLKAIHPHALRHSFATHLLSGGADLRVLQELLGHKTLVATQKYTHLDLAQLSHTLEKFHPIHQK